MNSIYMSASRQGLHDFLRLCVDRHLGNILRPHLVLLKHAVEYDLCRRSVDRTIYDLGTLVNRQILADMLICQFDQIELASLRRLQCPGLDSCDHFLLLYLENTFRHILPELPVFFKNFLKACVTLHSCCSFGYTQAKEKKGCKIERRKDCLHCGVLLALGPD